MVIEFSVAYCSFPVAYRHIILVSYKSCELLSISLKSLACLQIEDVADGAVKPPPNKIPIFFFGTHETWVQICCCVLTEGSLLPVYARVGDCRETSWRKWHFRLIQLYSYSRHAQLIGCPNFKFRPQTSLILSTVTSERAVTCGNKQITTISSWCPSSLKLYSCPRVHSSPLTRVTLGGIVFKMCVVMSDRSPSVWQDGTCTISIQL